MSVAVAEKVVCVTGAAGFIASWLVKLLLLRGYTVKATLRNPDDPTKTEHLLALEGAKERLHLFKADLLEEGSFDSIVEGCEGVFHTASPVLLEVANPKVELIDPAVNGTLNVLRSCTKVPSIRRVVVTSSIVATIFNGKTLTPDVIVDETWFSDPAFSLVCAFKDSIAEEAAWKFAKENGIDLVTMNPGRSSNISSSTYRWVDVRDVANAHVQAFEISSASGRYCLVERVTYCSEAIKILQELYPALHLPQKNADDEPPMATYQISKEKVKSLAIDFIPLEVSLKDTMENLKEMNFIKL
ncbi:Tetraketide alpha-pyrone reductase 1 [Vitis vinifera]|uniref:Tetraketide alpha-pyrone reductase 1 n=1 Tax=Vitis vinifera TaxID=29760 RepID=A0A438G2E9_VITVI|nr:Tetraketide alpha-pyrone reductase 1 [Vitis vinifera]